MAAVKYTKADWVAEADIKALPEGAFQGVVLITHTNGATSDASQHIVNAVSDTPTEALEEAKALAHRILGDL